MTGALEHHLTIAYHHRVFFDRCVLAPLHPLLARLLSGSPAAPSARLLIVIDAGLVLARPSLLERLCAYCAAHAPALDLVAPPLVLTGGESLKNSWAGVERILAAIHRAHLDRHSYLIALGGGALLDVAGFAATIAHRGLRHVRLPTTTLAQADSGVGVKNGINVFGQKNFVGAFAPPWAVVNDFDLLTTLSDRDKRCGAAEAVKVALIRDRAFFEVLEQEAPDLAALKPAALERLIRRCAELHLHHIATGGDPFETGSARPLDFGHWSAHKLERLSSFRLRHGEAVALGIALDTVYSKNAGHLPAAEADRVLNLLCRLGFRLHAPELRDPRLHEGLDEFREHLGGQLTLTLLRSIGQGFESHAYRTELLPACIDELERRSSAAMATA